ncbi:hypothetical protein EBZ35_02055 [bacterium]|nr:hypothetical protein [bacterium]
MSARHWVSEQIVTAGTTISYHITITPPLHEDPFGSWVLPPALCHVKRFAHHTPTHSSWTAWMIPLKEGTFFIPSRSVQPADGPLIQLPALPIQVLPPPTGYVINAPFDWVWPPLSLMPWIGGSLFMVMGMVWVLAMRYRPFTPAPTHTLSPPDESGLSSNLLTLLDTLNEHALSPTASLPDRHQLRHLFRQVITERYGLDPQWDIPHLAALLGDPLDHDTLTVLGHASMQFDRAAFSNHPFTRSEWIQAMMPLRRLLTQWIQPT